MNRRPRDTYRDARYDNDRYEDRYDSEDDYSDEERVAASHPHRQSRVFFLPHLPPHASCQAIQRFFANYGPVKAVRMLGKGKNSLRAYVEFSVDMPHLVAQRPFFLFGISLLVLQCRDASVLDRIAARSPRSPRDAEDRYEPRRRTDPTPAPFRDRPTRQLSPHAHPRMGQDHKAPRPAPRAHDDHAKRPPNHPAPAPAPAAARVAPVAPAAPAARVASEDGLYICLPKSLCPVHLYRTDPRALTARLDSSRVGALTILGTAMLMPERASAPAPATAAPAAPAAPLAETTHTTVASAPVPEPKPEPEAVVEAELTASVAPAAPTAEEGQQSPPPPPPPGSPPAPAEEEEDGEEGLVSW